MRHCQYPNIAFRQYKKKSLKISVFNYVLINLYRFADKNSGAERRTVFKVSQIDNKDDPRPFGLQCMVLQNISRVSFWSQSVPTF